MSERKGRLLTSNKSMTKRYIEITKGDYASYIYEWNMIEEHRIILSRWRLSCFDLAIETGRYKNISREDRLCSVCNVLEDEYHALFVCHLYRNIRSQFSRLITENITINEILHPNNPEKAKEVGKYLKLIERAHANIT